MSKRDGTMCTHPVLDDMRNRMESLLSESNMVSDAEYDNDPELRKNMRIAVEALGRIQSRFYDLHDELSKRMDFETHEEYTLRCLR